MLWQITVLMPLAAEHDAGRASQRVREASTAAHVEATMPGRETQVPAKASYLVCDPPPEGFHFDLVIRRWTPLATNEGIVPRTAVADREVAPGREQWLLLQPVMMGRSP